MTDFQNFCFYNGPRWYHVELFYECKHFETVNAKGVKIGNEHIVCILKHLTIGLEIQLHLCTNEWKMLLGNAKELPIQTKPKQMDEGGNIDNARQLAYSTQVCIRHYRQYIC